MAAHPNGLPAFDVTANCPKCGYVIPDPEVPMKAGPDGTLMQTGPAPAPTAPLVTYCPGSECPWNTNSEEWDEHMHQVCEVCGYEWLANPLDATV